MVVFFAGMNMFVGLLFDMKLGFVFSVLASSDGSGEVGLHPPGAFYDVQGL